VAVVIKVLRKIKLFLFKKQIEGLPGFPYFSKIFPGQEKINCWQVHNILHINILPIGISIEYFMQC